MNDLKEKLQEYIDYKETYWYHKMKAFEHMAKEANKKWERCFNKNNIVLQMSRILKNEKLLDQLLTYKNYGNFYTHAHNGFKYGENAYPKPYDETYEDISVRAIKEFYDWLEKDI